MRVSVCMSSYNRPLDEIQRVLTSILCQDPPFDFEVIFVNDGSPIEGVKGICEEMPIKYIHIDRPPGHRNPCLARNIAMKEAEGEVLVLQSDDIHHVTSNSLEVLVSELEENMFVIATVLGCSPSGQPWSEYSGIKRQVPYFFLGAILKKHIYEVGGNDEEFLEIPGCEDVWLAFCLIHGLGLKPKFIDTVIGHHIYHECRTTERVRLRGEAMLGRKVTKALESGVWCSSGGSWKC